MALAAVCDSCLRLTDAVGYAEEAASIQRRNFRLDVPSSVMSYTGTLRDLQLGWTKLGQHAKAMELSAQIISLHRDLHRAHPGANLAEYAEALVFGSELYRIQTDSENAVRLAAEAVALFDGLEQSSRSSLQANYGQALEHLCLSLSVRPAISNARKTPGSRAVQIRRELARADPFNQLERLAMALTSLAVPVGKADPANAVPLGQEAVEILQQHQSYGGRLDPGSLPMAMRNLAVDLEAAGDSRAAARMSEQAAERVRRPWPRNNPGRFAGELIGTLQNEARQLRSAGRPRAARRVQQEAEELIRYFQALSHSEGAPGGI